MLASPPPREAVPSAQHERKYSPWFECWRDQAARTQREGRHQQRAFPRRQHAHCYSFRPEFYVQPLLTRNLRDLRAQGIDLIGGGFQAIGNNVDLILQTAGFTDEQTDPLSPKELFDLFKTATDESFGKVEEIKN